jgi:hypothetical protein
MESLFDAADGSARVAFLRRVEALVAPVAEDAGAVVDDPAVLAVAHAVYEAFGDLDARGGLTRAEVAIACRGVCTEALFDSRFELFCRLGMLLPQFEKDFQHRYVFNPTSAAGLLVFERLAERGGVDELVTLLDRTRAALAAGAASVDLVMTSLRQARRMMTIAADHLLRLVRSSPLSELIAQRAHHSHPSLMADVHGLHEQVRDVFPDLDGDAYRLVVETQRYVDAREQFVGRLLDEGAAARDFSLLDPELYLQAAFTASSDVLAEVFAGVVFDPPSPWLDPVAVAEGVQEFRPRSTVRRRPARRVDPPSGPDPMLRVEQRAAVARTRRQRQAEIHLQGEHDVDLTSGIRAAGWPGAATIVVDALALHADPELPYRVTIDDELLVEPDAAVSYASPVALHRVRTEIPRPSRADVTGRWEAADA